MSDEEDDCKRFEKVTRAQERRSVRGERLQAALLVEAESAMAKAIAELGDVPGVEREEP